MQRELTDQQNFTARFKTTFVHHPLFVREYTQLHNFAGDPIHIFPVVGFFDSHKDQ
jgi:hypothetical protein